MNFSFAGQEERPEGFVEKIWSFVPTCGTVSTEMKHTQTISMNFSFAVLH